jgi:hypothetical protein
MLLWMGRGRGVCRSCSIPVALAVALTLALALALNLAHRKLQPHKKTSRPNGTQQERMDGRLRSAELPGSGGVIHGVGLQLASGDDGGAAVELAGKTADVGVVVHLLWFLLFLPSNSNQHKSTQLEVDGQARVWG